jgi:hypothetical protein
MQVELVTPMKRTPIWLLASLSISLLIGCYAEQSEIRPAPPEVATPSFDETLVEALNIRLKQLQPDSLREAIQRQNPNNVMPELIALSDRLQAINDRLANAALTLEARQRIGHDMQAELDMASVDIVLSLEPRHAAVMHLDLPENWARAMGSFEESQKIELDLLDAMKKRADLIASPEPLDDQLRPVLERLNIRILNLLRQRSDLIARRVRYVQ